MFQRFDKKKPYGTITAKDMQEALLEVHDNAIKPEELERTIEMLKVEDEKKFDKKQFQMIAAFSERLVQQRRMLEEKSHKDSGKRYVSDVNSIEKADLAGLNWKLKGIQLDASLADLLEVISKPEVLIA